MFPEPTTQSFVRVLEKRSRGLQRLLATESRWWREVGTNSGSFSARRIPGREPPVEGPAAWCAKREARVTAERGQ